MTRIAFVTGCLEPGRDGVGDYTRDLAAACIASGHACSVLALNDPYVTERVEDAQSARGVTMPALRLPPNASWSERMIVASSWSRLRDAEWLSLQFVPYALNPHGLVAGLERHLPRLAHRRLVHVMFHELWIGAERGARLKHRAIGLLQRAAVLRLAQALAPNVVHTSNAAYAALLERAGVKALELPLCGSVPIAPDADADWLGRELAMLGVPPQFLRPRERAWWFAMFGSIHPEWSPEPLFATLAAAARDAGRRVVIVSAGRQGPGGALWQSMTTRYAPEFALCALGERSGEALSRCLQSADFGIATTPWQLIGKSATAAAMLDHGLPVIVTRDDVSFGLPGGPSHPLLHRYGRDTAAWLTSPPTRGTPRSGVAAMAGRFLADLSIAAGGRASRRAT